MKNKNPTNDYPIKMIRERNWRMKAFIESEEKVLKLFRKGKIKENEIDQKISDVYNEKTFDAKKMKPAAYLKRIISHLKYEKIFHVSNLSRMASRGQEGWLMHAAYDKAIAEIEKFLVKAGKLKFERMDCIKCRRPFVPTSSRYNYCDDCIKKAQ